MKDIDEVYADGGVLLFVGNNSNNNLSGDNFLDYSVGRFLGIKKGGLRKADKKVVKKQKQALSDLKYKKFKEVK